MAYDKNKWKQYLLSVPLDTYREMMMEYKNSFDVNERPANQQEVTRVFVNKGLEMVKLEKELNRLNISTSELIEKLEKEKGL